MHTTYFLKADRVIKRLLNEGKREFALFPFGERGMMVKDILNRRYGVHERYIVDNGLSSLGGLSLDDLKKRDVDDLIILLTSDNEEIYSDIRFELMQRFPIEKIVDLFSDSMYFDPEVRYENYQSHPRLAALEANAREIYLNHVEGAIAECGVYRGNFANHMSRLMPDRKLYLFDTFSGFDGRDIDERECEWSKEFRKEYGTLADTTVESALEKIGYRYNAVVRQGYFPDTAKGLEDERFAFVSLDTDLYKPILAGLEFFYPRLNPGGVIFVDDLGHHQLLGVREAVVKFCKQENIGYISIPDGTDSTAVIVKPW